MIYFDFSHLWIYIDLNERVFWSLDQLVVETLGVAFVRPFVRSSVIPYATLFLGNRSLFFSETLQLVRACQREKNVPSVFLIIFAILAILAKNCQNGPFGWRCGCVSLRAGNP